MQRLNRKGIKFSVIAQPRNHLGALLQLLVDVVRINHGGEYRHMAQGLLHQVDVFGISLKFSGE